MSRVSVMSERPVSLSHLHPSPAHVWALASPAQIKHGRPPVERITLTFYSNFIPLASTPAAHSCRKSDSCGQHVTVHSPRDPSGSSHIVTSAPARPQGESLLVTTNYFESGSVKGQGPSP